MNSYTQAADDENSALDSSQRDQNSDDVERLKLMPTTEKSSMIRRMIDEHDEDDQIAKKDINVDFDQKTWAADSNSTQKMTNTKNTRSKERRKKAEKMPSSLMRGLPNLTPPADPKHQTQKNFLASTH